MTRRDPNFVDVHVGSRIRMRRQLIGMSQEKLGELLGITFQQVQKYENGRNRVSAGRLYELAKALGVTIQYFYEGAPRLAAVRRGAAEEAADFAGPAVGEEIELLAAFRRIEQASSRKAVIELAKKQARPAAKTARKPAPRKR